jgi:hypothetical protein
MNRTIKEATAKRYHYTSHEELKTHLQRFLRPATSQNAQDQGSGHPYEYICKIWPEDLGSVDVLI